MARLDVQAARLQAGETVKFRPKGSSMEGKISSGDLVTCVPVTDDTVLKTGDAVLCKVKGLFMLHCIYSIHDDGGYEIRGYNRNHSNGVIKRNKIYGKCVRVES